MATFGINIEFEVKADDYESAETIARQIIEAARMEDLIKDGKTQDIEMLDDDEVDELDFNEDDE